jgi:cytoskeletal protein CcmA (bactofilin family)
MAQNYTRQSSFADGDTITAALFNNEFNQVVNAFAYSSSSASTTGHRHDGTAGQGGNIPKIGDLDFLNKILVTGNTWEFYVEVSSAAAKQMVLQDGALVPNADSDLDLGTSSIYFKDAYIDSILTTGNVTVGGIVSLADGSASAPSLTNTGDTNAGLFFSAADTLAFTAGGTSQVTFADGVIAPVTDSDVDLGTSSLYFKDSFIDTVTTTGNVTVGGTIVSSSTIQGTTITATTAFVPDASDGASLGSTSLEFSDLFLADGALIAFGDDQDVTLTHLADAGLLLNGARGLFFNDTSQYINAPSATVLDIAATDEIELTATLVDVVGNLAVSGNVDVDGNIEFDGLSGTGSVTVTNILDEDNMASDSATALATQQSIKAYVDAQQDTVDTFGEVLALGNTTSGTNVELTTTDKVQFRDSAIYINSSADGQLDIVADTEIQIAATTIDIDGAINASGEIIAASLDISGNIDVDGTTNLDVVDIDGAVDMATTLAVAGNVDFNGDLDVDGTTNLDVVDIDGAVDMASTLAVAGVLTAASLDISGDVDVDGTLETDALTIAGVTLSETIADTVGAMVSSNTESGITVAYQDADNTLDFTIGTLNQNTTGSAATLTTARTIGGTSFNGSANIAVGLADTTTALATARTIGGVSFDGTANIVPTTFAAATFSGDLNVDSGVLFADVSTNRVGVNQASPDVSLDLGANTDAVHVPVGTTGERPGSAAAGYFRYNSSLAQFEGYTDAWGAIGGGGTNTFTHDVFTCNGSTTAFALSQSTESEDNLIVFIDGVFQEQGAYSIATSSGTTTLTLSAAPVNGRKLVVYTVAAGVSGSNLNIDTMTGDGSDTTLTLSINPVNENNSQVFIDGVYQNKSTYAISGTTLTFSAAPPNGSAVEVMTMTQTEVNVPVDGTITSAKLSGALTTPSTLVATGKITADAGIDIDNINIDGTTIALSSGDLTLDVAGDIILDADGAQLRFHDAGTDIAVISNESNNLIIKSQVSDADLIFKGNDGGSSVTALTLDMSAAGFATFNNGIKAGRDISAYGANTGSVANRMALSMEGSGVSRIICNGADGSTNGTFEVFTANSGGTGSVKLGVDTSGNVEMRGSADVRISLGTAGTSGLNNNSNWIYGNGTNLRFNNAGGFYSWETVGTERMRINAAGQLLIGTTTGVATGTLATSGLEVVAPQNQDCIATQVVSAGATCFGASGPTGGGGVYLFGQMINASGSQVGSISVSASATAYNTSSDYRLKENVVAISNATERLKQLNPSRFNFIADADTTVDGFLAHEVQAIVPEAITGTKDAVDADGNPDYQGIDQSKLVPLLVATIQELEARLTALENN